MKTKLKVKKGSKTMNAKRAVKVGAGEPVRKQKVTKGPGTETEGAKGRKKHPHPGPLPAKGEGVGVDAAAEGLGELKWNLEVGLGRLTASPTNRKFFSEEGLAELAASIKTQGVVQALVVRPRPEWVSRELQRLMKLKAEKPGKMTGLDETFLLGLEMIAGQALIVGAVDAAQVAAEVVFDPAAEFEIVCGERRWRAASVAGLERVPCCVRILTDDQARVVQKVENAQREAVQALEEAEEYAAMIATGKWTAGTLAEEMGVSKTKLFERLKLARLEGPVKAALREGKISASVAAAIATVPDGALQAEIMEEVVFDSYGDQEVRPVRDIVAGIEENYIRPLKDCGWGLGEWMEYDGAVCAACAGCPRMTRNMIETNPELVKGPARCLDVGCFKKRGEAVLAGALAVARSNGLEVLKSVPNNRNGKLFVEGQANYVDGTRIEPGAAFGKVAHTRVGVVDGKLRRVWTREELERAGVLKAEPDDTENWDLQVKQEKETALMEAIKAEALLRVKNVLTASAPLVGRETAELALLQEWCHNRLDYGTREKTKPEEITRAAIFERLADQAIGRWRTIEEPPYVLEALGIGLDLLKEVAKDRVREAAAAKAEQEKLKAEKKKAGQQKKTKGMKEAVAA